MEKHEEVKEGCLEQRGSEMEIALAFSYIVGLLFCINNTSFWQNASSLAFSMQIGCFLYPFCQLSACYIEWIIIRLLSPPCGWKLDPVNPQTVKALNERQREDILVQITEHLDILDKNVWSLHKNMLPWSTRASSVRASRVCICMFLFSIYIVTGTRKNAGLF